MNTPWKDLSVHTFRRIIQIGMTAILIVGGIQYFLWVAHFRYGTPYVPRPSNIEAFLPISAMVGAKAWIATGYITRAHPASLVIFIGVVATAILFHRGVCSWVCPIGLVQDWLRNIGTSVLGKRYRPPDVLDYPLRAIKFLILGFFVKVIFFDFSGEAAIAFLQTPYNAISAVKLLDFWIYPSLATIVVVGILVVGTMTIDDLWCRYLCPYGALLSIVGRISPTTVTVDRDETACTDCGACTTACPNRIAVEDADVVTSLECTRCSQCITACSEGALEYEAGGRSVSPKSVGLGIILILFIITGVAMVTGHWDSAITYDQWAQLIRNADSIGHAPYR